MSNKASNGTDKSVEWYTPPEIVEALGPFDLDPAFPVEPLYQTAVNTFNKIQDGLAQVWSGRVWLNPPYNNLTEWMRLMADNNNGVALIPARVETVYFQQFVFKRASSILFLDKRVHFLRPDGSRATDNSGAPSVLIAYNEFNSEKLIDSGIDGAHVWTRERLLIVGFDKSWRLIIQSIIVAEHTVEEIYKRVEAVAPGKVNGNKNYRAKIRQVLQFHFRRTKRATYAK